MSDFKNKTYNPNKNTEKQITSGGAKDYARAILGQGLAFGFGDEAEAFTRSLISQKDYEEILKEVRADIDTFRKEQPVAAYGSEIAGAVLPALLTGGTSLLAKGGSVAAQSAAKTMQPAVKMAAANPGKTAAIQGGLYGVGTGEGSLVDRAEGGVIGAGLGGGMSKLAGAILPKVTPKARELLDEGIPLTPGQAMGGEGGGILGGALKVSEEGLSSVPGTGVNVALRKGQEAFNRKGFEKAVEGIKGIKINNNLPVNKLYADVQKQLSTKYDEIVPNLKIPNLQSVKGTLLNEINSSSLSASQRTKIINRYIKPLQNRNKLAGEEVQKLIRKFKTDVKTSLKSDNVDVVDEGELLKSLQNLVEKNTSNIKPLKQIDNAYLKIQTLGDATIKSADDLYTAAQLRNAIKTADKSRGKIQFKRGDAKLQDFAETSQDVLGRVLPDSGTTTRAITGYGLLGGAGSSSPITLAPAVSLSAYLASLQNPVTNTLVREGINLSSRGIQSASPYIGGQLGSNAPTAPNYLTSKEALLRLLSK